MSLTSFPFFLSLLFISLAVGIQVVFGQPTADEQLGDLFHEVQIKKVFKDYKTFVDCAPKESPIEIEKRFQAHRGDSSFDLKTFVKEHFVLPDTNYTIYTADTSVSIHQHIDTLWNVLTRQAVQPIPNSSLIHLPHPYVIPGGRFREVFYWDSYFIMLGLQTSGRFDLLKNMIDNFTFLIDSIGFIPNGNRTYFLSRSQPPFYAMMVDLMAEKDKNVLIDYLPYLVKEYEFWMHGHEKLTASTRSYRRVVRMPQGEILNRYWDEKTTPRPEAYGKELAYSEGMTHLQKTVLYRNIRAACESGWDFSTRWFKDGATMQSIHTVDLVPVDLNCLLYFLEETISKAYHQKGDKKNTMAYAQLAKKRKDAILRYCWSDKEQFFMDYNFVEDVHSPHLTLAGAFPLFIPIATQEQAKAVGKLLHDQFLKDGGFVTTLLPSHFQWDSPNGWAPLQWTTVKGLLNYNQRSLAQVGASKWMHLNEKVYKSSGKLVEKYNVVEKNEFTGGGEYALQDGFGWTNGVYVKLAATFNKTKTK